MADKDKEWLTFAAEIASLRAAATSPWLRVRAADESTDEDRYDSCALIPNHLLAEELEGYEWTTHDDGPEVVSDSTGTHTYLRLGSETGIEPLVLLRTFSGQRPSAIELLEEFRLFHDLYHDEVERQYLRFDEAGDPQAVVRYSKGGEQMEVLARPLRQFMAWKGTHLALYVTWHRFSVGSLEELGLKEVRRHFIRDASSTFGLTVVPYTHRDGYRSLGRLVGKALVRPLAREVSGWGPYRDKVNYQSYIVGLDDDGKEIELTCAPEVSEYRFLTRVWFRSEVLKKYLDEPGRFTVEDGQVVCRSRWYLPIDNDHRDHVVVFLGDLRSLPEKEQRHWRVHNIPPSGDLSETAFRRSFLAEWVASERPEHRFARAYESLMEESEKSGVQIIRPLMDADQHCLKALHVPTSEEVAAFDHQVGNLTKLLVDSIADGELEKHIVAEPNDKSIRKLETYLSAKGCSDYHVHIALLRDLQSYRSTNAAHRRGRKASEAFEKLSGGLVSRRDVFASILERATALLEYLRSLLASPDPS